MPYKSFDSSKRLRQPRIRRATHQGAGQHTNSLNRLKASHKKRKTYYRKRKKPDKNTYTQRPSGARTREVDKRLTNCIVVYTLFLLTASILWGLQVPEQVVFVLLVIPTLLIPPYLIPLRTHHTKVVDGSLVIMIITILVAVLSFDQEAVLQILNYLFP